MCPQFGKDIKWDGKCGLFRGLKSYVCLGFKIKKGIPSAIKNATHTHLYIYFFGICDHEVQLLCEFSTVINTSIAVFHWEFRAN